MHPDRISCGRTKHSSCSSNSSSPKLQNRDVNMCRTSVTSAEEAVSVIEAGGTDSETVSSASENGSTAHRSDVNIPGEEPVSISNSPSSDIVVDPKLDHLLPSMSNFKLGEFDEPCTLSPIDSPRSLIQSTSTTNSDRFIPCDDERIIQGNQYEIEDDNLILKNKLPTNALNLKSGLLSGVTLNPSVDSLLSRHRGIMSGTRNDSLLSLEQQSVSVEEMADIEYPCIYAWGWNEHGNCGLGSTSNVLMPRRVPVDGRVVMVAAGSGHSFALIRNYSKLAL